MIMFVSINHNIENQIFIYCQKKYNSALTDKKTYEDPIITKIIDNLIINQRACWIFNDIARN